MAETAEQSAQSGLRSARPSRAEVACRSLDGRTILVLYDEPLILLDLVQGLEKAGATVLPASSVETALRLVESPDVSLAVLDWIDAGLCRRLTERGLPFVIYSGRSTGEFDEWRQVPVVAKPARPEEIISALERLL